MLVLALWAGGPAEAQAGIRAVSINTCTDQLLMALADPEQIAGLSRFSRNAEISFLAREAKRYPKLRGTAEEVLRLRPGVVLAGAFSGRATREMLSRQGVRVETFQPPRTIEEATREIARAAGLLGHPDRGRLMIEGIEAALGEARRRAAGQHRLSVLALQRRSFASGPATLISTVLTAAGLDNAAPRIGIDSVGQVPLEAIVRLAPDVLAVEGLADAPDQSTAVLHHPVLARLFPPGRRMALPVAETTCGGPGLAPLIEHVSKAAAGMRARLP